MRSWRCALLVLILGAAPVAAQIIVVPPTQWDLQQNDPNPVCPNPSATVIRFAVPQPAVVKLVVLSPDATSILRTLTDQALVAGVFAVAWDGRDATGAALADATYPYRMTATIGGNVVFEAVKLATLGCTNATERQTWSQLKVLYE